MEQLHPQPDIMTDFVLGLLPPEESRALQAHAAECDRCRADLAAEVGVEAAVRETLQALTVPSALALQKRMPAPPVRARSRWLGGRTQRWMRPIAATALALVILFYGVNLQADQHTPAAFAMTQTAAAATAEPTPTLTATATAVAAQPQPTLEIRVSPAPVPQGTPEADIDG